MTSRDSKVVELKASRQHANESEQRVLSAPLKRLREASIGGLKRLLRTMLDSADDALFELADKASSNSEQTTYFDAMREVRLKRQNIEVKLEQNLRNAFAYAGTDFSIKSNAGPTEVDSLTIVEHDELEEMVAIDGMIKKIKNRAGQPLEHLNVRIASLLPGIDIQDQSNPLGPESLCRVFIESCDNLDLELKLKLIVYKLYDKFVLNRVDALYDQANQLLIKQGVLPDLKAQSAKPRAPKQTAQTAGANAAQGDSAAEVIVEAENETFTLLQHLLHGSPVLGSPVHGGGGTVGAGVVGTGNGGVGVGGSPGVGQHGAGQGGGLRGAGSALVPVLSQSALIGLLTGAQQQLVHSHQPVQGVLNFKGLIEQAQQQTGQQETRRLGEVEDDVINLVAMLFEFILDDRQLPDLMKALIARLQIPVLKLAIGDKAFFSKSGHPARRLLNELATAAVGWTPKAEGERDLLREKVEHVVQRMLTEFEDDISLVEELLAEFTKFTDLEKRRMALVEQRTRDAEEGKARSEQARQDSQQTLSDMIAGRELPATVVRLLRDGWQNYMTLVHLKQGVASDAWREAMQIAHDLIWSVNPPQEPGARRELLRLIPGLLKGLRAGLSQTPFNKFELDSLLLDLEALHVNALQDLSRATPLTDNASPTVDNDTAADANEAATEASDNSAEVAAEAPAASPEPAPMDAEADATPLPDPMDADSDAEYDLQAMVEHAKATSTEPPIAADEPADAETSLQTPAESPAVEAPASEPEPPAAEPMADHLLQQWLGNVDKLAIGSWFELSESDGRVIRCKFAAQVQVTGKYIFVNRTGIKVAEYDRQHLAAALAAETLKPLDDGLLFDRALEAVIGNLRNRQTG